MSVLPRAARPFVAFPGLLRLNGFAVAPEQTVVLAPAERPPIRRLPNALTIEQVAAKQGKVRGALRGAADFPRIASILSSCRSTLRSARWTPWERAVDVV